jgi:hypothetical protein
LAKCKLDINHPNFRIVGGASDKELQSGLASLCALLAKDHTLSGFANQPMKSFVAHQNRVWKWDFRPEGETSSTRKGWRLYGYRFDLNPQEPLPVTAFLCYDKAKAPKSEYAKFLAGELKRFLSNIKIEAVESKFRQQTLPDGSIVSLCYSCGETAARSHDLAEVEIGEATHECPPNSN